MKLREYQERFVKNIAESLVKNKKVIAQLATGGGKTVCFAAICQRFTEKSPDKNVLILVHRKELLNQAIDKIQTLTGIKATSIEAGIKTIPDARVYVGMVETSFKRLEMFQNIGLVIIDECHLGNFNKIIDFYDNQYIIGFTATPLSAKKDNPLKDYFNDIVVGVSISELIDQKYLCEPISFGSKNELDRAKLKMTGGDFNADQMGKIMSAEKYVNSVLEQYKKLTLGYKTLIFNCSIEHSLLVCNAFKNEGFNSRHLDSNMSAQERTEIMDWFDKNDDAILCNVSIATTGFDQPDVKCIIVNRATASMPLWLQMCGRGSRPAENKDSFIIIDFSGNVITHGFWEAERDWQDLFFNPPKKKTGVAPVKQCPECEALVHMATKICKECNYEFPQKPIFEYEKAEIVALSKNIDLVKYINIQRERNYKLYASLFQALSSLVNKSKINENQNSPVLINSIHEETRNITKRWSKMVGLKRSPNAIAIDFVNSQIKKNY